MIQKIGKMILDFLEKFDKNVMSSDEYCRRMYPDGQDTKYRDQKCPVCGGTNCWDLDDNTHTGDADRIEFSCSCGAEWTEIWKLEKVVIK